MHSQHKTLRPAVSLLLSILLVNGSLFAQVRTNTSKSVYLNFDNTSVATKTVRLVDTIVNGRMMYTGTIELLVTDETTTIVSRLQQSASRAAFTLTYADMNMKAGDVLNYSDVSFREISISGLDAASRDAGKFTLVFSAPTMKLSSGDGNISAGTKSKMAGARPFHNSNFRVTIPGLNSSRIATIEKINFSGSGMLRITVSSTDEAQWRDLFYSGKAGRMQGSIELLSVDMREIMAQVDLKDIEFVSYDREVDSSVDRISRFGMTLRVRQSMISLK